MKIGNLIINDKSNTFIIAEIGINHNGSVKTCKKMILEAVKAGADAVKIQLINHNQSYQKGTKSYSEFKNKSFTFDELKLIKNYAKKLKTIFFATPGDIGSFYTLVKLGIPLVKISSGLMNNYPLIKLCREKKLPVIVSTGLALDKDLKELKFFLKKYKFKNFSILKCTSEYPAKVEDLNLNKIHEIKKLFKCTVGYSDHFLDYSACVASVFFGAKIIEKHFTLNKKIKGADHHISLQPEEFKKMVFDIRNIEKMLISYESNTLLKKIKINKTKFLRKIVALKNIKKGETFNLKNIGFLRLKSNQDSLEPKYFFSIENRQSCFNLKKGTVITKKHISKIVK